MQDDSDQLNAIGPAPRKAWPDDYNGDCGNTGLRCPRCNWADLKVDYTRHVEGGNDRKRICKNCGLKGMTVEKWRFEWNSKWRAGCGLTPTTSR